MQFFETSMPQVLSCPFADAAILIAGFEAQHVFVSDIPFHPRMPDHKLNGDVHWTMQHLLLPTVPTCFPIYAVNKAGVLQIRFSLFMPSLFIY